MNRFVSRLGLTTLALVAGAVPMMAQGTQTANITGTVVDGSGAPMAGASVRLTSPSMQGVRNFTTDVDGKFIARLLPPGAYTIAVVKEGMDTRKVYQQLGIDQTFTPRITMAKAGGAIVEVIATNPAVDKTDVKTASNYRNDDIDKLPNGRGMAAVALLTPGVTTGVGNRVQIRGAQTSGNLYLVDGQNVADNAYNTLGVQMIDDSVEETQIITGAMSAEYGDVDGGVLNSITRSGSNEFSGSLRWELNNPIWNAVTPLQNRDTSMKNVLGEEKTLFLSGPILKDKLWFAASFFQTETNTSEAITAELRDAFGLWRNPTPPAVENLNGPGGLNAGYVASSKRIRRQFKLTYAINQDHTLIASFNNSKTDDVNRNYSAGELKALVPQISTAEFYNVAWRAMWGSNFTTDIRFGGKKQNLSAGGAANGQSPFYNYDNGRFYNNGIFNSSDGGDQRDNKTLNIKASLFWNAAGSHQTDFGMDYFQGIRTAKNEQTPTGYIIGVLGLNMNGVNQLNADYWGVPVDTTQPYAFPSDIWVFQSGSGSAKNDSIGLYVNDKWSLDQHWNFQLGLRYDKYAAKNEGGKKTAGASGISPRLGVKFDLFGDSKHIFGASYAKYNAKVLEGITNSVTSQGNPTEVDFPWIGNFEPQTFAELQNLANYDLTGASGIYYYNDPTLNVKLSNKLKAPTTIEIQASYAYSYNFGSMGDGFVKLTGVSKKWDNLIDYSVGNNGTVQDPTGADIYVNVWDNNPDATRKYKGLEMEVQHNINQWTIGGNITWSELRGNYEGEGTNSPARGEGIHRFDVQDGVTLFDSKDLNPEGYLDGHQPISMRGMASKAFKNAHGKTTLGFIYRFNSGEHFSHTRSITRRALGGTSTIADPNYNPNRTLSDTNHPFLTNISSQFGSTGIQYRDQQRGAGVFNASAYLDLAITHEFPLFKVAGRSVNAFAKARIFNVLNHQQQITFSTAYAAAPQATVTATNPVAGSVSSPWVPSSSYGKPTNANNYGTPRTILISAGIRF